MTDLEEIPTSDDRPARAKVLDYRNYEPLPNKVDNATADTVILLNCPDCDALIEIGPRTGHYKNSIPWLTSLCPSCGARFSVVQHIKMTWQPQIDIA